MGSHAIIRLRNFSYSNDWITWIDRLEGYSNLIKLYCINVNSEYGNEYPCYCKISSIKKESPQLTKDEAILEASKKMMLPILYTVLTTICAFLSLVFQQE